GEAGHAREHWLRDALDALHHLRAALEQRTHAREVASRHVGEVVTRAEYGALGIEQHAACLARADLRERSIELRDRLERERVAPLRAREGHVRERVARADVEVARLAHRTVPDGMSWNALS